VGHFLRNYVCLAYTSVRRLHSCTDRKGGGELKLQRILNGKKNMTMKRGGKEGESSREKCIDNGTERK
jgi:hypothetical protein